MKFNINWNEHYANEPTIDLVVQGSHTDWTKMIYLTCPVGDSTAAVSFNKGVANYGIYHNLKGEPRLATRSGEYLITVQEDGKQKQLKFDAWSSSRPSVMNDLFPNSPTILNVRTTTEKKYFEGYATLDLIRYNLGSIPKGIYLLLVDKIEKKTFDDANVTLIPSLSPTEFKLPETKTWQAHDLNQTYRVIESLSRDTNTQV